MSGSTSSSSQRSEPWAAQQPYLESLFGRAEELYQNRPDIAGSGLNSSLNMSSIGRISGDNYER